MSIEAQKVLVLLAFALVCAGINMKSSSGFLSILTLICITAALSLATGVIYGWVIS